MVAPNVLVNKGNTMTEQDQTEMIDDLRHIKSLLENETKSRQATACIETLILFIESLAVNDRYIGAFELDIKALFHDTKKIGCSKCGWVGYETEPTGCPGCKRYRNLPGC